MITKSLEASRILTDAVNQLKKFVLSYDFKDVEEEISTCVQEIEKYLINRLKNTNDYNYNRVLHSIQLISRKELFQSFAN